MKKYFKIGTMVLVVCFFISISSNAKSIKDVGTTSNSMICNNSYASNAAFPYSKFQTMQGMSFRQKLRAYLSGAIYGSPLLKPLDQNINLSNFDN